MDILMVILPVFFVFGLGYASYFFFKPDIAGLAQFSVYLLLPFLSFDTFYRHELSFADGYLILYSTILALLLVVVVYIAARLFSYGTEQTCATILSSVFMNSGNYGIPIILLAFGEAGRVTIIFLSVFHGVLQGTIGIYYAVKGGGGGTVGIKVPLMAVLKMPVIHAIIAGTLFQKLGIHIPENLMLCISMLGNASIPMIMLILGMQLATISLAHISFGKMNVAILIKLVISPLIAWVLTLWMPADTVVKQIFILTAGMPTAAGTTLLAIQFKTDPKFVSGVTFASTLLSIPSIALMLYMVQRGIF
jgi:Predicted permeases